MYLSQLGPTPADAVEQLTPLIALGVSHIIVFGSTKRTIERFAEEAVPELMKRSLSSLQQSPLAD